MELYPLRSQLSLRLYIAPTECLADLDHPSPCALSKLASGQPIPNLRMDGTSSGFLDRPLIFQLTIDSHAFLNVTVGLFNSA
jgi:hypothetical protein